MDLQDQVQRRIDELAETELGLQVAAYRHGQLVVDAVAGDGVTPETLYFAASTGKGASATVVNVLVDRGVLDYDRPIVEIWPEFGAHGKDKATLRHVLTHSVGLPALPSDTTRKTLPGQADRLAGTEPWWEPGTKMTYHAETFGVLAGEIVRRATGQTISDVLRDVLGPLGIENDVFFALPPGQAHRIAPLVEPDGAEETFATLAGMFEKVVPRAMQPRAAVLNQPGQLAIEDASSGILTARGIAKLYAALIGEVDGVRLVRPEAVPVITGPALVARDELLGNTATLALGYAVGRFGSSAEESPASFGWPGMGGSVAWADTRAGVTFALTRTLFDPSGSESAAEIGNLVAKTLC
ncbi:serine hydrolase domain-containing protein [Kribbella shirazensis]|uniref:CubicO group peptidase (Beta-lactamase class C family) n=1 Tax=Kribbella shirazensis TaxID=1105143 RepID=A0A7X5V548_9ACTN|nr:serine hydrolase domain-containing protein [Kribbella shirazensis]NIK54765.1 CubicO group peptidase (beta-lactamase class C family) [Kribbella shirazensis]